MDENQITLEFSTVTKRPDGSIFINTREGVGREFASLDDIRAQILQKFTQDAEACFLLGIANWLWQEPNGDNPNKLIGFAFTLDPFSSNTTVLERR